MSSLKEITIFLESTHHAYDPRAGDKPVTPVLGPLCPSGMDDQTLSLDSGISLPALQSWGQFPTKWDVIIVITSLSKLSNTE